MIQRTVERMYSESEENRFLEVTYANGDKETLYFKDFNSGAMIQNIVDRGKKMAIKDLLTTGQRGLRMQHLLAACVDEFRENEDLPNTTNPDDWARISGKKGERIVYIRTLISGQGQRGRPRRSTRWATPASTCSAPWASPASSPNLPVSDVAAANAFYAGRARALDRHGPGLSHTSDWTGDVRRVMVTVSGELLAGAAGLRRRHRGRRASTPSSAPAR